VVGVAERVKTFGAQGSDGSFSGWYPHRSTWDSRASRSGPRRV
jgi:hypothetical protein